MLIPDKVGAPMETALAPARLSLAPEHADPVRLWRAAIAALRALEPGFGRDAERMLAAGPAVLDGAVLPLIVAEMALMDSPPVLVLAGLDALGPRAARIAPSLARFAALGGALTTVEDAAPRRAPGPIAAALAAGRDAEAAGLIAGAWEAALRRGEEATVLDWLDALPERAARDEARLWVVRRWAAPRRGAPLDDDAGVPPHVRARGHLLDAAGALRHGDLGRLARCLDAAAGHDPQDGFWHTADALLRAHDAFWRGHPRVAHRHFTRAAGLAAIHGDRFATTAATGYLAVLAAEGGDDEAARRRLDRLEDLRDADPAVGEHPVAAAGALAEGRLLELAGAYEGAAAPLRRAIALAERGGSRFERAEPRLRLASVHRACGRPEEAAPLEAEALALLRRVPDRGRLAGLAAAVAPAAPRREPLSPGERAILRLLPSGLSQREIGGALDLSVNTVKTHCRNIYIKLGAGSREDAVARAQDVGLL
jgi:LuxR family maltose regulon positive regulatory protein